MESSYLRILKLDSVTSSMLYSVFSKWQPQNVSIRDNCGTITFPSANVASDIVKEHTFDPRDPPFIRIVTDDIDRDLRIECCLLPEGGIRLEVERAWPTVFQENGMGYVLDTRSGMFYERESNFWYDPKTSLYCNAATSFYYSHSMLSNPPFTPVTPATFAASTSTATTTTQAAGLSSALSSVPPASASAAPAAPGKVAMKLKLPKRTTKSSAQTLPSKPPQAPSPPAELTAPSAAVDKKLSEWASRNTELRESEAKESEATPSAPNCLLCRRKFPTFEALSKHVKKSAMHKANLEKEKGAAYRDRVRERNDESTGTVSVEVEEGIKVKKVKVTEDDVGRRMLEKMGYGKKEQDKSREAHEGLRKDWDRIDSGLKKSGR